MASDPAIYSRMNFPQQGQPQQQQQQQSPMCPTSNPSSNLDPQSQPPVAALQNPSPSQATVRHQQASVASPYAVQGAPHSVEDAAAGAAYHMRQQQQQHASPYQAPQQSPANINSVPTAATVSNSGGGGQYHTSQPMGTSELNRSLALNVVYRVLWRHCAESGRNKND